MHIEFEQIDTGGRIDADNFTANKRRRITGEKQNGIGDVRHGAAPQFLQ